MSNSNNSDIVPFLKWAGGKRWLLKKDLNLFPKKNEYHRYFEPFLGSGAVFFYLQPQCAFLSDINFELVETYKAVKLNPKKIKSELMIHERNHSSDYYYMMRSRRCRTSETRAARFIYLNRTCWNGLYRVNSDGGFNVPIGTKTKVVYETDNFDCISELLKTVKISANDFSRTIMKAKENDFVFVDPLRGPLDGEPVYVRK